MAQGFILHKYQQNEKEYIVFDINQNEKALDRQVIRSIRTGNFGTHLDGILVGPYSENGVFHATVYDPDSGQITTTEDGNLFFHHYLQDAGYIPHSDTKDPLPWYQSKIYCWC